ncbi:MAG: VWA domain-containing protein [Planctomycetota bacterium]|nr:MAG: VWA domain-containing protein [Planctomycetota bacterium]
MNPFRHPLLTGATVAGLFALALNSFTPAAADDCSRAPDVAPPTRGDDGAPRCQKPVAAEQSPRIDVVFVVDTTGSMGGLIEGAKRKVWSIANEILSGRPRPRVSVGLIAYRDRGDAYVTQVTPLTEDLDAIYARLQGFRAEGGGDGPEHVNRGLHDAFSAIRWNEDSQLKLVYLVGDAPAHRDYDQEIDYARIVPEARQRGIVVNAVLCGNSGAARRQFVEISRLGGGEFFQIAQDGGMTAVATPYDERLRRLARELEETRVVYGSRAERKKAAERRAEVLEMDGEAAAARASAVSKMAPSAPAAGGSKDLVAAFEEGRLDEVREAELPEPLQGLSESERKAKLAALAARRKAVERELAELAKKRDEYQRAHAPRDGFDARVLDALKRRAQAAGIHYER